MCKKSRISSGEIKSSVVYERKPVKGFDEGLEIFKVAGNVFSLVWTNRLKQGHFQINPSLK